MNSNLDWYWQTFPNKKTTMYRRPLLALISLFFLHSFGQNEHSIIVSVQGATDKDTVFLNSVKDLKDTSIIKNGEAHFFLHDMKDDWITYFIRYRHGDKEFNFPLFGNAESNIKLSVGKELSTYIISGDANAKEQNEFWEGWKASEKLADSLAKQQYESSDSAHLKTLQRNFDSADKAFKNYPVTWISKHKASPFSAAIVRMFIDKTNILRTLDTVAVNCYNTLLPQAKVNNYESDLLLKEFTMYDDTYSKVSVDSKAPAFLINDTTGHNISLESFKDKWLLIDFWASWCGPCRQNNPLLKNFYNSFHKKGLEILSVSVDTDSELWKQAIKKDDMIWHQGSDLSGLSSGIGQTYQINAVPCYFLISPKGIIIMKSVGGDINALRKTLDFYIDKMKP